MDTALEQAKKDIKRLIKTYLKLSSKFEMDTTLSNPYHHLVDFTNARFETIDSCRLLLKSERVSDVLALNRSLLEHYLLFILFCRGRNTFHLVEKKNSDMRDKMSRFFGKKLLSSEPYPYRPNYMALIVGGPELGHDATKEEISWFYYSVHKMFNPEVARLDGYDYFGRNSRNANLRKIYNQLKKHQKSLYQTYLSYDSLLYGLQINDIIDKSVQLRIQAHYTFLGKFLHPTTNPSRVLREMHNNYSNKTVVGSEEPYRRSSVLLSYIYLIKLTAGFLQELTEALDNIKAEYWPKGSSSNVKKLLKELDDRYSYFWFIFNGPSDYDKYMYCQTMMSDDELEKIGKDYRMVEPSIVTFEKDIYKRFSDSLPHRNSGRVGKYISPIYY